MEKLARGEKQELPTEKGCVTSRDYYSEIDYLAANISKREFEVKNNIAISAEDLKAVDEVAQSIYKELALMRQDTQKLEE